MVERFGQLDQICIKPPSPDGGRLLSWSNVVRIDHVPVLTLWVIAVAEPLGVAPIDFPLVLGGKGI